MNVQGKRSDLEMFIKDAIKEKNDPFKLKCEYPHIAARYPKFFEDFACYGGQSHIPRNIPVREEAPEVTVLVGPTGTGKTRKVWECAGDLYEVPLNLDGNTWFDGYAGHSDVLMDEFEGEISLRAFKRILDRYNMRLPKKGGYVLWKPDRIWITSNRVPFRGDGGWYERYLVRKKGNEERTIDRIASLHAVARRFTRVIFLGYGGVLIDSDDDDFREMSAKKRYEWILNLPEINED